MYIILNNTKERSLHIMKLTNINDVDGF